MARPVDARGFVDIHGNSLEIAHHDDEVIHVDRRDQNDRPLAADQSQLLYQQIFGHQSRVEEHHHNQEGHDDLFKHQTRLNQHIGGAGGQQDVDGRAHHGDEDGIPQGGQNHFVGKNDVVIHGAESRRNHAKAAHGRRQRRVGEGLGQNIEHGDQHCQRQKHHHGAQ